MGHEGRAAAEGGWQYCTRRAVLPVQALLRPPLREPARVQDYFRKTHRKVVRKYHPDTNPGDPSAGSYSAAAPLGASE